MRLILAMLLATALLAAPARATPEYVLPTLFDVTGVRADDVLNIRERPDAGSAVIGTLPPGATGVEVVAEGSGGWMQVNTAERSGWVNGRYLTPRADVWREGALPQGFACFGTEPFWHLSAQAGRMTLRRPEGDEDAGAIAAILGTGWFRDPRRVVLAGRMTLVATPKACSDGMSDRAYGLEATVILGQGGEATLLNGCCSIAGR